MKRQELLESIAGTISDYRAGQIPPIDAAHVERWIKQFDKPVRDPILTELDKVLKETYLPKQAVKKFLASLVKNEDLATANPCTFWRDVAFLDIQQSGNSQHVMLTMFDEVLHKHCGFHIKDCGGKPGAFVYLDDAIFSGNRVLNDIRAWLKTKAPKKAKLHVFTVAFHRGGQWYANQEIEKGAEATLSRWETGGQIQQRSLDKFLRLFFGMAEVRAALAGSAEAIYPENGESSITGTAPAATEAVSGRCA